MGKIANPMWNYQCVPSPHPQHRTKLTQLSQARPRARLRAQGPARLDWSLLGARLAARRLHVREPRSLALSLDDGRRGRRHDPRDGPALDLRRLAASHARQHSRVQPPDLHHDRRDRDHVGRDADVVPFRLLVHDRPGRRLGAGYRHRRVVHSRRGLLVPGPVERSRGYHPRRCVHRRGREAQDEARARAGTDARASARVSPGRLEPRPFLTVYSSVHQVRAPPSGTIGEKLTWTPDVAAHDLLTRNGHLDEGECGPGGSDMLLCCPRSFMGSEGVKLSKVGEESQLWTFFTHQRWRVELIAAGWSVVERRRGRGSC